MYSVFFFNDTATTEIYTLSLHDALPILTAGVLIALPGPSPVRVLMVLTARKVDREVIRGPRRVHLVRPPLKRHATHGDRKSTRLNSSHANISSAVFCLKKKNAHSRTTLT